MVFGNTMHMQQLFMGLAFPATREEAISYAASQGADEDTLSTIQELPDEKFASTDDIVAAIHAESDDENMVIMHEEVRGPGDRDMIGTP